MIYCMSYENIENVVGGIVLRAFQILLVIIVDSLFNVEVLYFLNAVM